MAGNGVSLRESKVRGSMPTCRHSPIGTALKTGRTSPSGYRSRDLLAAATLAVTDAFDIILKNLETVAGHVRLRVGGNFLPGEEASYERLLDRLVFATTARKSRCRLTPSFTGG